MTSIPSPAPVPAEEASAAPSRLQGLWQQIDVVLERCADRLNPILVKEARQALKSRQFVVTFTILLMAGWLWSFFGLAMSGARLVIYPAGSDMLIGYVFILAFAMMVVVPFSAFRSLSAEREDGTYELLSITTLSSRHIVSGKLGSNVLQMLVYLSAMSPFITFTYLLRGVDIITIGLLLFYSLTVSIALSVVGLMFATLAKSKQFQSLLSIVFVAALLIAYFMVMSFTSMFFSFGPGLPIEKPLFWLWQLSVVSIMACLVMLCFLAAAAQLSFASENRSTRLRVMMLIESVVFLGWILFFWADAVSTYNSDPFDGLAIFCLACLGTHWALLGTMMVGESPHISRRVQRRLPVSSLGRAFLTWFSPGPGTGYFFAIANMAAAALFLLLASGLTAGSAISLDVADVRVIRFGFLLTCYLAIFLGIGRLLMMMYHHRTAGTGIVVSVLIQAVLLVVCTLGPVVIHSSLDSSWGGYSLLHITNPFWTLDAIGASYSQPFSPLGLSGPLVWPVMFLIGGAAAFVFVLNLWVARKQIGLFRTTAPERLQADDLELHPELAPPPPKRESPWD